MMNKFLVFFFLATFASVVTAQADVCQEYIFLAEERLAPPYPNYFGAAGEYQHSAECYDALGQTDSASLYSQKAAEHYITAAETLVEGGDYYQRAKSYEFAGDAYYRVGQRDRALQLYNTARGLYETHNFPDDALSLTGLISQRFGTPIPQNQTFSPIAIIAVIALIGIGFWFFRKKKDKGYSGDSTSPDEPDISAFAREIPQRKDSGVSEKQFIGTVAPKQQSAADTAAKEDAKQKMARKIRERYGLKPEQE